MLESHARQAARISSRPVYVLRELVDLLRWERVVLPVCTILQNMGRGALAFERKRLAGSLEILDWKWEEDRCTLRTDHSPENITRLLRFATGLTKSKSSDSVTATIAKRARDARRVFDYLRMTDNSFPRS
jgi:hypothetical protein